MKFENDIIIDGKVIVKNKTATDILLGDGTTTPIDKKITIRRVLIPTTALPANFTSTDVKTWLNANEGIGESEALFWETVVTVVNTLEDYIARVLADSGIVENETQLDLEVDFTSQAYLDAIAIYNPNGGKKVGKIYDVRDTDNTSPNDLTVTGGGGTRFLADETLEAVPFEMPKIDYSTGKAAFLIESEKTNHFTHSYNPILAANWETTIGGTNVLNEVGITGIANTAVTLNDTSTGTYYSLQNNSLYNFGTIKAAFSFWIKKDNNETRFPEIYLRATASGTNTVYQQLTQLNTKTGAFGFRAYNEMQVIVNDRGLWWEVVITPTVDVYATTQFVIRPAMSTTIGTYTNAATGSIILGHVGVYNTAKTNFTPIITNGAAVTRTALSASIPVPAGVTSIEEKVDGVINTITTIPATYTMPNGAVEYVKFL